MMVVLSQIKHKQRQPRITRQDIDLEPYTNHNSKMSEIEQVKNNVKMYQSINDTKFKQRSLFR